MRRAVELAGRGVFDVEPNPPVGAVVLADERLVGEGWHRAFGGAHAEVEALAAAGSRARGATLVVTLEPCSTTGKTPPCTDAVLAAGIARVVVGCADPNPVHAGAGLARLADRGVDVAVLDDAAARALLVRFERELTRRRPHVLAKWAMTRDGVIGHARGELAGPMAVSGEVSRALVHEWRAHLDAIVVGVETVVVDDPRLTARGAGGAVRALRRVVLDPTLRTPDAARLVTGADAVPTWIVGSDDADPARAARLEELGVRVLRFPAGERWLDDVLAALRLDGVHRLMVEGGSRTLSRFLARELVDQIAVFVSPHDATGPGLAALEGMSLAGLAPAAIVERLGLLDARVTASGEDTLVRGFTRAPERA